MINAMVFGDKAVITMVSAKGVLKTICFSFIKQVSNGNNDQKVCLKMKEMLTVESRRKFG